MFMPYLCFDCYEVYDEPQRYDVCPKSYCSGSVQFIDELMLPIIVELNQKGYCTEYCCSGHAYNYNDPYIKFNHYLLECWEMTELFVGLPDKWHIDGECIRYNDPSHRFGDIYEGKYHDIVNANAALLEYVKDLPVIEW